MIIANPLPASGRFFHTFDEAGQICWQGRFLNQVRPAVWRVQLYSFLDGEPTNEEVIHLARQGIAVYPSARRMNEAYAIAERHDWENEAMIKAYEYI